MILLKGSYTVDISQWRDGDEAEQRLPPSLHIALDKSGGLNPMDTAKRASPHAQAEV